MNDALEPPLKALADILYLRHAVNEHIEKLKDFTNEISKDHDAAIYNIAIRLASLRTELEIRIDSINRDYEQVDKIIEKELGGNGEEK